jgi:hypothetical protein
MDFAYVILRHASAVVALASWHSFGVGARTMALARRQSPQAHGVMRILQGRAVLQILKTIVRPIRVNVIDAVTIRPRTHKRSKY